MSVESLHMGTGMRRSWVDDATDAHPSELRASEIPLILLDHFLPTFPRWKMKI